jgi:hypothetical protein
MALDVCFGNHLNYRREKLEFEVMDWPSQYHAILGRPMFLRFMAVPHYTYMVLKMAGPKGVKTVKESFELSDICDKEFHKMAQSFSAIAKYGELKGIAKHSTSSLPPCLSLETPIDYQGLKQPCTKRVWDSCYLGITLFRLFQPDILS